ncbi:MAG: glycosyltransferase family 2 protein [Halanaerobiales bacterium]
MKVSVIIPTHNRPQGLIQAVNSVISQEKKPDEIIIIDDASSVRVSELLKKSSLASRLGEETKLIVERFEFSKGGNVARNRGASLASGDILMFLDDDDTWEISKVKDQVNIFCNYPDVGLVYSGRLVVSDQDRETVLYRISPKHEGLLYPKILYSNLIGTTSSVALRKQVFEQVGGFDENLPACQDYDLWIRCCENTLVKYDKNYNIKYTISEQSKTQISNQAERHLKAVNLLLEKYQDKIFQQTKWEQRKVYASRFFAIAKARRNESLLMALPWLVRSFFQFPSLKTIGLIFPKFITQPIMKRLN